MGWALLDAVRHDRARDAQLRACAQVLDTVRPDVVHVVDLVHLPSELPELFAARGLPVVRHVWNAEDVCGLIEPVHSSEGLPCPPPATPAHCASCALGFLGPVRDGASAASPEAQQWRDSVQGALEEKRRQQLAHYGGLYDRVLFPSQGFRDWFSGSVPVADGRGAVLTPGLRPLPPAGTGDAAAQPADGVVRFLFLGPGSERKGSGILTAVLADPRLQRREDYHVTLYGMPDDALPPTRASRRRAATTPATCHGCCGHRPWDCRPRGSRRSTG